MNAHETAKKRLFRRDAETNTRDACATQKILLKQFQPRQILGIDDPDRNAVIINHDQVVDAVAFEEIKNFNGEFIFMHSHRVQSHQICNETFADL